MGKKGTELDLTEEALQSFLKEITDEIDKKHKKPKPSKVKLKMEKEWEVPKVEWVASNRVHLLKRLVCKKCQNSFTYLEGKFLLKVAAEKTPEQSKSYKRIEDSTNLYEALPLLEEVMQEIVVCGECRH